MMRCSVSAKPASAGQPIAKMIVGRNKQTQTSAQHLPLCVKSIPVICHLVDIVLQIFVVILYSLNLSVFVIFVLFVVMPN